MQGKEEMREGKIRGRATGARLKVKTHSFQEGEIRSQGGSPAALIRDLDHNEDILSRCSLVFKLTLKKERKREKKVKEKKRWKKPLVG